LEPVHIGGHPKWIMWGLTFNSDTLTTVWLVSLVLIIFAIFVRIRLNRRPSKLQAMVEMAYEALESMVSDKLGHRTKLFIPFAGTLFMFILLSNWLGILPFDIKSPTADINVTAGFALMVILVVQLYAIYERGILKYLHRFIEPYPLFLPLNIVEEIAKPFSLAVRLFGNVFSKETILLVLTSLVVFPIFYPIPILALGIMIGAIQAYVFTLLTVFYISMALESH
jgi:F-type H+-transporting ATPase subunit a